MACTTLLGVCLLASVLVTGLAFSVTKEAEDFAFENQIIDRGNAGNLLNVHLNTSESIVIPICVTFDDVIQFEKLYYSNDGTADDYIFEFDGKKIGKVTSEDNSNYGENWNKIEESGLIGGEIDVFSGRVYDLRIWIENGSQDPDDGYGAEIDRIVINFGDEANGDLSCAGFVTATDGVTGEEESTTEAYTKETTEGKADCEGGDC